MYERNLLGNLLGDERLWIEIVDPKLSEYVQVYSYYKMRSNFFVPIPSIEGSTGPNWMKFCMGPSKGISRVTIEGFFDIRSGGPDMGYPWGPRGGQIF